MSVAEAERRMAAVSVAELLRAAFEDAEPEGDGPETPARPERPASSPADELRRRAAA